MTKIICIIVIIISSIVLPQNQERNFSPGLSRDQSLFPLQSASVWTEVHPLIPRVTYWGVHFVSADTGWAVGEGGAIIKTTNGGQKWIWYESGVENTLKSVSAVNSGQRVLAAGDGGIILVSEDAGESWNTLPSGTTQNIWNIQMITDKIGWMVGESATALKTTDGGLMWIQQTMPHTTLPYWDVSFIDTSFGYICCNTAIVLKTTNGGGSWQIQQAGDTRSLFTINAFDTLWASAAGFAGKVVYTTNGGIDWLSAGGNVSATEINKIKFINDTTGFMASNGSLYKSTNKGVGWFSIEDPGIYMTTNISFPNGRTGYIVGAYMYLIKTDNEGLNWKKTIVNDDFLNVYFKNEQNGFINSNQIIYTTNDGGRTLHALETFPYSDLFDIYSMTFIDSLTGYIGTGSLSIYKTTNRGLSWYRTNVSGTTDTIGTLYKIYFLTNSLGFAVSDDGKIFKTTDSGENWLLQLEAGLNVIFQNIFFIDSLVGWTANLNRPPYKTTDGGNTWILQSNLNIWQSLDVYFKDTLNAFIIESNRLYKTINGGLSWNMDSSITGFGLGRFGSFDADNIFISGTKVYRTTNAGIDWTEFPELQSQGWRLAITLFAVNSGYLVGNTGLLVKYFDESLPVELLNFQGWLNENETHLIWITGTEINNSGFYIQRKTTGEFKWSEIGFIEGNGNSTELNYYSYKDILREAGVYYYRLKQIDFNGAYEYSKEIELNFLPPTNFKIFQNFPNPFNPTTNVRIILPEESIVTLKLFNILGELVKTIISNEFQAGVFDLEINLSGLCSGIYFYNITAQEKTGNFFSKTKKMILTK